MYIHLRICIDIHMKVYVIISMFIDIQTYNYKPIYSFLCSLLIPYWTSLCVLRGTCRQSSLYETLFHCNTLSKHHHHTGDLDYHNFVCIEPGTVSDFTTVTPQDTLTLTQILISQ
jgi:hypothetical protein